MLSRSLAVLLIVSAWCAPIASARARQEEPRPAKPELPDATLDPLRAELAEVSAALEAGDRAGARARIAAAVQRALADIGERDDEAAYILLEKLARAALDAGELGAAEAARRRGLECCTSALPAEHFALQRARLRLGRVLAQQGNLQEARALQEQALEILSRTVRAESSELLTAKKDLASTIDQLGEVQRSRELFEQVLAVLSRTLPDDDSELQTVRVNYAQTISSLGDLQGARVLLEKVLAVRTRTLAEDAPGLASVRMSLASTICMLGDLQGARALFERVLEVFARTLPDDHLHLQLARADLAGVLLLLGDLQSARALYEKVIEVGSRTLPEDNPDLLAARLNYAALIHELDDFEEARRLFESVLETYARALPADHPDVLVGRMHLAVTCAALGDFARSRELLEQALAVASRTLPDEHVDVQLARRHLAATLIAQTARAQPESSEQVVARGRAEARDGAADLLAALCRAQTRSARAVRLTAPGREAEARCAALGDHLEFVLSAALGPSGMVPLTELVPDAFAYAESTRNAAVSSGAAARRAAASPRYVELRGHLGEAIEELTRLAQSGTTGEEFQRAHAEREAAERALISLGRELSGGHTTAVELDAASLGAALKPDQAAVSFRRFARWKLVEPGDTGTGGPLWRTSDHLCAFVVRSAGATPASGAAAPILLDLGPLEPITAAIEAWQRAVGVDRERGSAAAEPAGQAVELRGAELRRLVLDPVLAEVGSARKLVLVLDDALHLVPLDALPLELAPEPQAGRGTALVGERYRIEVRATLGELLDPPAPSSNANLLLALGGASFNSQPVELAEEEPTALEDEPPAAGEIAALLRGTSWARGFEPLPFTSAEAHRIAALHAEVFEERGSAQVLEKRKASRAALEALAPRARWLHVATHGWYASASIRSWDDPRPIDEQSGLGVRLSGEETVKGMSPMLLSGLALAGANLPEDGLGRVTGLMTAEELASLDLSRCELVVLSACDTARGEMRRACQGVASLQKALQVAGARSAITSLWKVPDEATKELMLDFYRRLWVEQKPKWQALWEAKLKLRAELDERGNPLYSTRDWAAWILTGEPE